MEQIVYAKGLMKKFGEFVAVAGIDLNIFPGECFGFLGANGAGKTSTMRMISCVSPIAGGELWVNGKDVKKSARHIKAELGVVSQEDTLDSNLSVLQNLQVHARYFNISAAVAEQRALDALDLFQLRDRARSKVDELSGGMKRRLLIARALLQQPRLLILDEPTTGLDPQARHLVWQRVQFLKSQQITIILSTHYMEEASSLCDRLAVMDAGHIVAQGTPEELIRDVTGNEVVEIFVGLDLMHKQHVITGLRKRGLQPEDGGEKVLIYGANTNASFTDLEPLRVVHRPANLEDVFLRLTGRALQEE